MRERETEGKSRGFEFCFCTLRPWNLNWLTFPSSCCCLNNLLWSKRHTVQRKQAVCSVLVWPQGGQEDETRETFVLLSVSHTNVFKPQFRLSVCLYQFFCHFVVVLSIWFCLSFCLSKFILSINLSVCHFIHHSFYHSIFSISVILLILIILSVVWQLFYLSFFLFHSVILLLWCSVILSLSVFLSFHHFIIYFCHSVCGFVFISVCLSFLILLSFFP